MRMCAVAALAFFLVAPSAAAQETPKPVPKDSMRVSIPGCTKGQVFTAAPRTTEEAGSVDIPVGTHLRMNGPKKLMAEIKAHEGSMIVVTGLMKKGQYGPAGVGIGGGVRVMPGGGQSGGISGSPNVSQNFIDVEGWRQANGDCPVR